MLCIFRSKRFVSGRRVFLISLLVATLLPGCLKRTLCDSADPICNQGIGLLWLASFQIETLPVSGSAAWYRANAGVEKSATNTVNTWDDLSGNGNHLNGNATWVDSIVGGKPVVRFSAASLNIVERAAVHLFSSTSSGLTIFSVLKANDNSAQRMVLVLAATNCTNNLELGYTIAPGAAGVFGTHIGCGNATVAPAGTIANGSFIIMTTRIKSSGSPPTSLEFFKNGTTLSSANQGTGWISPGSYPTSGNLAVGGRDVGGTVDNFHDGDIAEIAIYPRPLTDAERVLVECYLSTKYSLSVAQTCN